ncbi:MAG TPA: hypothetical protein PLP57_07350 [Candidatus Saccharicenans sp.]|nr:hypothetical protein [Candidatus Saccharicenans sp.]HRD02441.1 hypothetical protein [Candidatus Saccharicenans sp.]
MTTKCIGKIQPLVCLTIILAFLTVPLMAKEVYRGRMLTGKAPVEPAAVDIQIEIESWTTPEEIIEFNRVLASSGSDTFLSLFNSTKKGVVRFLYARGYNLTIHMAQAQEEENGKKVIVVLRREPWSQGSQLGVGRNYFMAIELNLNKEGKGEGRFYEDAQIEMDVMGGKVYLKSYESSPKIISSVKETKKK